MNIAKTSYKTTNHSLASLYLLLYIAASAGMGGMLLTVWAGAPILVCMAGLFIPMLLVLGFFSGATEYSLDETGLHKQVNPWLRKGANITKSFAWADVKSYKTGTDMTRSLQQYEYLQIYFKGTTWQLTDQKDRNSFLKFKEEFIKVIELINNPITPTPPPMQPGEHTSTTQTTFISPSPLIVQRKKTIYETIWARLFFWLMLAFTIGVLAFLISNPQYMSVPTGFRLLFVIVPGLIYLWWRLWGKKKQN